MRPVKIDWKGNTFYRAAPIAGMSTVSSPQEQSLASVVIVDYGLGNLRSVTRGLERAGADVEITDDPAAFAAADGVVLPGVGAFREGVENADPLREDLLEVADSGTPSSVSVSACRCSSRRARRAKPTASRPSRGWI